MPRRWREAFIIGLLRRVFSERRMRPGFMVIVDPAADPGPGLGAGLEGLEIDALVLERAP